MRNDQIESLVPPPELCKQIPPGEFEDSALVHARIFTGHIVVVPREAAIENDWDILCSAPTLEEIMAAMARMEVCPGVDMLVNIKGEICGRVDAGMRNVSFCGKSTPAEAALKRWLELKGEGEK